MKLRTASNNLDNETLYFLQDLGIEEDEIFEVQSVEFLENLFRNCPRPLTLKPTDEDPQLFELFDPLIMWGGYRLRQED